jgi:hypothetical protein
MRNNPLIIIGPAQHGKDTAAEYLAKHFRLVHRPASQIACDAFIYPLLKNFYASEIECWEDRVNNRQLWYNLIRDHCSEDKAALGKLIFKYSDVYTGVRAKDELQGIKEAFPEAITIWVDSYVRLGHPKEPMTVGPTDADYGLTNNGSIEQLHCALNDLLYE